MGQWNFRVDVVYGVFFMVPLMTRTCLQRYDDGYSYPTGFTGKFNDKSFGKRRIAKPIKKRMNAILDFGTLDLYILKYMDTLTGMPLRQ